MTFTQPSSDLLTPHLLGYISLPGKLSLLKSPPKISSFRWMSHLSQSHQSTVSRIWNSSIQLFPVFLLLFMWAPRQMESSFQDASRIPLLPSLHLKSSSCLSILPSVVVFKKRLTHPFDTLALQKLNLDPLLGCDPDSVTHFYQTEWDDIDAMWLPRLGDRKVMPVPTSVICFGESVIMLWGYLHSLKRPCVEETRPSWQRLH